MLTSARTKLVSWSRCVRFLLSCTLCDRLTRSRRTSPNVAVMAVAAGGLPRVAPASSRTKTPVPSRLHGFTVLVGLHPLNPEALGGPGAKTTSKETSSRSWTPERNSSGIPFNAVGATRQNWPSRSLSTELARPPTRENVWRPVHGAMVKFDMKPNGENFSEERGREPASYARLLDTDGRQNETHAEGADLIHVLVIARRYQRNQREVESRNTSELLTSREDRIASDNNWRIRLHGIRKCH